MRRVGRSEILSRLEKLEAQLLPKPPKPAVPRITWRPPGCAHWPRRVYQDRITGEVRDGAGTVLAKGIVQKSSTVKEGR